MVPNQPPYISRVTDDILNMFFFQLRIVVYDRANPAEKATAAITIEVNRNENSPSFTESTYRVDAVETMDLGSFIADVNATDSDGVRLVY